MKQSVVTRIGLSPKELARVRKLSTASGVPMTRLLADLVRDGLKLREQAA